MLQGAREERREITLSAKSVDDASCLEASGAIRLTIKDVLPTVDNSLGLPPGLDLDMGVKGSEVWPVSVSDVEIEEEDEAGELNSQQLSFAKSFLADPVRTGITVEVSNMAIDSAGFDLLGFIQQKFALAQRKYLAAHLYSSARFDGNNGPFSSANVATWEVPATSLYDEIVKQMTALEEAGFDSSDAVLVMDPFMECRLKYAPIRYGEGRMIIQDGLCAGYPYVVNNYFNTTLDSDTGKLVRKDTDAIGIALFKYFKVAQHGDVRMVIDGVSREMAAKNCTSVTLLTSWSFTDLSRHLNGGDEMQAFRTIVMARGYLADVDDTLFVTSDGLYLTVGMNDYSMYLADSGDNILTADGEALVVNINE